MPCIVQDFNLTQAEGDAMDFYNAYHHTDALTADQFDGIPINCDDMNDELWLEIEYLQKVHLSSEFSK